MLLLMMMMRRRRCSSSQSFVDTIAEHKVNVFVISL
jgi:hypothetical protein